MATAFFPAHHNSCACHPDDDGSACVFRTKGRLRHFRSHQAAFHAGTACRSLYQLRDGLLVLCSYPADGHRSVVRVVRPGEIVGWADAFVSGIHRWEARTLTACSMWEVAAADWHDFHSQDAYRRILALAYAETQLLERAVMQMARLRIEDRLLAFLASFVGSADTLPAAVRLPIRRYDIAEIVGTTPETCSRILRQLQERGVVTWHGADTMVIGRSAASRLLEIADQVDPGEPVEPFVACDRSAAFLPAARTVASAPTCRAFGAAGYSALCPAEA